MNTSKDSAPTPFHRHTHHLPHPIDPDTCDPATVHIDDILERGFTRVLAPHEHAAYAERSDIAYSARFAPDIKMHRWIRRIIINPPLAEFCTALPSFHNIFSLYCTNALYSAWTYLPPNFQQRVLDTHSRYYLAKLFAIHDRTLPLDWRELSIRDFGCFTLRHATEHIQREWWTKRLKRPEIPSLGELIAYCYYPSKEFASLPISLMRWVHPDDSMDMTKAFRKILSATNGQTVLYKRTGGFYLFPCFDLRSEALAWASPKKQLQLWQIFASLPADQCLHLTPPSLKDLHRIILTTSLTSRETPIDLNTLTRWIAGYQPTMASTGTAAAITS